jgi:hypothetical protein
MRPRAALVASLGNSQWKARPSRTAALYSAFGPGLVIELDQALEFAQAFQKV